MLPASLCQIIYLLLLPILCCRLGSPPASSDCHSCHLHVMHHGFTWAEEGTRQDSIIRWEITIFLVNILSKNQTSWEQGGVTRWLFCRFFKSSLIYAFNHSKKLSECKSRRIFLICSSVSCILCYSSIFVRN